MMCSPDALFHPRTDSARELHRRLHIHREQSLELVVKRPLRRGTSQHIGTRITDENIQPPGARPRFMRKAIDFTRIVQIGLMGTHLPAITTTHPSTGGDGFRDPLRRPAVDQYIRSRARKCQRYRPANTAARTRY